MRLDKYLADAGLGTRSEVKKIIKSKQISVNDMIINDPGYILKENDCVIYKNQKIEHEENRTYLFYKPSGCVTANEDQLHKTVFDYFPASLKKGLNAVGRLDIDTEGLLLLTTDGGLLHHLISPSHNIKKTYYAELDKKISEDAIDLFREGIDIGDEKRTLPAELEILNQEKPAALLTIQEGRYHQVKRMFLAFDCKVIYLKRISEGFLTLGDLQPGEYRQLSEKEIELLRKN